LQGASLTLWSSLSINQSFNAKGAFAGLGLKVDVVGEENIPLSGGVLLAINHTSYMDFALGGIPAHNRGRRLVRFMAKDSILSTKLLDRLCVA